MEPDDIDWKSLWFLPSRYEVSPDAQVRTKAFEVVEARGATRRYRARILKQYVTPHGASQGVHPVVSIRKGVGRDAPAQQVRVAYLTACAHLGLPYDRLDLSERNLWRIAFKDGDPLHCHVDNLEWVPNFGSETQRNYLASRERYNLAPKKTARQLAEEMGYEWDETDLVAA